MCVVCRVLWCIMCGVLCVCYVCLWCCGRVLCVGDVCCKICITLPNTTQHTHNTHNTQYTQNTQRITHTAPHTHNTTHTTRTTYAKHTQNVKCVNFTKTCRSLNYNTRKAWPSFLKPNISQMTKSLHTIIPTITSLFFFKNANSCEATQALLIYNT